MSKKLKLISFLVGVGVLLAGGTLLAWNQGLLFNPDRALYNQIKHEPSLVALFNKAKEAEQKINAHPEVVAPYFDAGLYWKSIAEQMPGGDRAPFFKRSLAVYERGIKRFGQTNILFYLNGGKLAERVADYAKAEAYYRQAIAIAPGDESGYINLADIFAFKTQRPKADILALYTAAEKRMINPVTIIAARASYLRHIGDYAAALKDYITLSQAFPKNEGYQAVIAELQAKLRK